jgi:hypothetical protein
MTLPDRISKAIAGALVSGGITTTVQAGIESTANTEGESRIICTCTQCPQRSAALRGIYNPVGEVHILQSIHATDAITDFRALCTAVREILGDEYITPEQITAQDSNLHIYNRSWHLDEQMSDAGDQGFKATFSWRAVVRDTLTT